MSRFSPLSGWIAGNRLSRLVLEKAFGLDRRRRLSLAVERFQPQRYEVRGKAAADGGKMAVLFSDVYTSFSRPAAARATMAVLEAAGVEIKATRIRPEGRAELSQGLVATAAGRARAVAACLEEYIDSGRQVVVVEPSVLALFRHDYRHLLNDERLFGKLKDNSFDAVEFLLQTLREKSISPEILFSADRALKSGDRLFIHGHCQQKSVGAFAPVVELFENLGCGVGISEVECCGMAGSFGYKKDFYELSIKIGEDLFRQIGEAEKDGGRAVVVAAGVSCRDQISDGTGREVLHPMELLERMLIS